MNNNYRYKIKLISLVVLLITTVNGYVCCFADSRASSSNLKIELVDSLKSPHNVSSLAWSPDERFIASGGILAKTISIWDVKEKKIVRTIDAQAGGVGALAYSSDGKYLAVGRTFTRRIPEKYHINVYSAESGTLLRSFFPPPAKKGYSNDVKVLVFSPDGKLIATNVYGTRAKGVVYDVATGKVITTLENLNTTLITDRINALSFSPDGKYLAVGHGSGVVNVWLKNNWKLSYGFVAHDDGVYSLAFSVDSGFLSSASMISGTNSKSNDINIWKLPSFMLLETLQSEHTGYVRRLQYSPNGSVLVSGGSDKSITLFNMKEPFDKKTLKEFSGVAYPYISPRGSYLAIATGQYIELWQFIESN